MSRLQEWGVPHQYYCSLWPGVVALNKVLSMSQIEQTVCKQIIDIELWLLYSVAERKNFKLLFSAGIVLAVGVSNLHISSNENDWCHSAPVTFPGIIKGCVSLPRSLLFLIYFSSRTDWLSSSLTLLDDSSSSKRPSQHEMSTFNFWVYVPLGIHSFIIYSFLLDPLVLETSRLNV